MILPEKLTAIRAAAGQRRSSAPAGSDESTDFAVDVAEAATELSRPFGDEIFESRCGFNVRGDGFAEVVGNVKFEFKEDGATVGVFSNDEPVSVLLVLESGFGVLVAVYPGFIGNLTMGEQSLNALHYEPSIETDRRDVFEQNQTEIRTLRAIAAAASKKGVFRLHTGEADKMARRMQLAKGIDPSLAIYAAHAYAAQGNDDYLQQMENYLGNDLGKVPFDVALLSGRMEPKVTGKDDSILPFLPMLSQTWALLPAYDVVLPPGLEDIQHHLAHSSLWSLFKPSGVELIRQAFKIWSCKMTRELVLIHGRAQENYDPDELKKLWITALKDGLAKSALTLPIAEDKIHFPYYGDTLFALVDGIPADQVAEVIVRGDDSSDAETEFIRSTIRETLKQLGITDEKIQKLSDRQIAERGIANWEWIQTGLKALDYYVPYASSAAVALRTKDVYQYLNNPVFRKMIDDGVAGAFNAAADTVVVGHSLGAVVSYNVLNKHGADKSWKVPLYVTVGAPLAVTAIKEALKPIKHPPCAKKWFNAMDERDVVPLYPLDSENFDVDPAIENKTDVDNFTDNRHGIAGYLSDAVVAKKIHDALTQD